MNSAIKLVAVAVFAVLLWITITATYSMGFTGFLFALGTSIVTLATMTFFVVIWVAIRVVIKWLKS